MSESNYWNRLHSTRLSRRSALRGGGLGLAGLTGALLIGCGDDDEPAAPAPTAAATTAAAGTAAATATATATASGGTTATPTATATTAPTPAALDYDPDGTLRVAIQSDSGSMDPQEVSGSASFYNGEAHFGKVLVTHPVSNDFVAHMASLEWVDANEAIILKLQPGIIDHEGFPYLAEDLVWSIERAAARGDYADREDWTSGRFTFFNNVGTPEAVDDLTVRVPVLQPDNTIPGGAFWTVTQVARRYIERVGDVEAAITPSGFGPYRFESRIADTETHSTRYDDYFWDNTNEYGPWKPWHKELVNYTRPEPVSRLAGLRSGEFDYVPELNLELGQELEGDEDITVNFFPRGRGMNLQMSTSLQTLANGEPNPFNDKRVRIAANLAIDRDGYINTILHGTERYSFGLGSLSFGFPLGDIEHLYWGYDVDRAKGLMTEAGYGDGFDVDFYYPTGYYAQSDELVLIFQRDLEQIGIRTNLITLPRSDYFKNLRDKSVHGLWLTGGTRWPASMNAFYKDDGVYNQSPNPESRVTELWEKSLGIFDQDELKETLNEIWIEHYTQAQFIYLHEPLLASAYNNRRLRWLPDGGEARHPRIPANWEFQVLKT